MDTLIEKIVKNPDIHRRWLATLSFLELSGAQKIASYLPKNLHNGVIWKEESELMQHAAEEFRHAYFFHKLIEKVKPASTQSVRKLCKRHGSRYLQVLDLKIARCLRQKSYGDLRKGCYLLTTYAIEKRAQLVYEVYERSLKSNSLGMSIRSILLEENGHLRQIEQAIASDPVLVLSQEEARTYEQEIFSQFWKELDHEISLTLEDELASFDSTGSFSQLNRWTSHDKISPTCA